MGIFGGVTVTGFIAPSSSGDTYAVIDPIYGIDGLRSVTSSVERNAITTLRRRMGMIAYQQDNNTYYKLLASPWINTDADWEILTFGSGGGISPYSNILVSASTANNYSGSSIPYITGYSASYVYITTFNEPNTSSASTININGLGDLDLVKVGETGLIPLDPYDVLSGVTYYTIYNGTNMQLLISPPVNDPSSYTTFLGPIPINIGGVSIGTQFSAATMQQVFDTLFYPYQSSTFTSFYIQQLGATSPLFEVGRPISGGSYNFIWATSYPTNVKPGTIIIKNNVSAIISTPTSGMSNDFTEVITLPAVTNTTPGVYSWRIYGTRTNNIAIPFATYTANWRYRRYWGNSALAVPTSGMVTSLNYQDLNGQSVYYNPATAASAFPFSGAPGTYKHICYPTSAPSVTVIKDDLTLLNMAMADPTDGFTNQTPNLIWFYMTVPIMNQYGITNNYKCFRSKYQLGGAMNIRVN